jgi:hypothetical protein
LVPITRLSTFNNAASFYFVLLEPVLSKFQHFDH